MTESTLQNKSLWYNQSRGSRFAQKTAVNYVQFVQKIIKMRINKRMRDKKSE